MTPPAATLDNNQTKTTTSVVDQARDFIHQKVATDEQLQQEKPMDQKLREALPHNAKELVDQTKTAVGNLKDDVKDKFQQRLNEGTEREHQQNDNNKGLPKVVDNVRHKLYNATKSDSVKEREDFQNANLLEKMDRMRSKEQEKKHDTIPPATMMT